MYVRTYVDDAQSYLNSANQRAQFMSVLDCVTATYVRTYVYLYKETMRVVYVHTYVCMYTLVQGQ